MQLQVVVAVKKMKQVYTNQERNWKKHISIKNNKQSQNYATNAAVAQQQEKHAHARRGGVYHE